LNPASRAQRSEHVWLRFKSLSARDFGRNGRDEQRECAFPRRPTHVVWGVEATQLVLEEGLSDIPPWSQIWNPRRVPPPRRPGTADVASEPARTSSMRSQPPGTSTPRTGTAVLSRRPGRAVPAVGRVLGGGDAPLHDGRVRSRRPQRWRGAGGPALELEDGPAAVVVRD